MAKAGAATSSLSGRSDAGAAFAVGFDRSSGDLLVYGMAMVGAVLLVSGIGSGNTMLTAATLLPLALAFRNYPLIDRSAPQLGANGQGLFVERLGFISWAEIADLDLQQTSVRNMLLARLIVTLHRPLNETAIQPHAVPVWKRFMMKNWRHRKVPDGGCQLILDLHPLTEQAEDVMARLCRFLPPKPGTPAS